LLETIYDDYLCLPEVLNDFIVWHENEMELNIRISVRRCVFEQRHARQVLEMLHSHAVNATCRSSQESTLCQ